MREFVIALTMQDFREQIGMVRKLGSLKSVMNYMPGMGGMQISREQMQEGDRKFQKYAVYSIL